MIYSENCVLIDIITQAANPNVDPAIAAINAQTNVTFEIKDTRWYVSVVTLTTEDNKNLSEQSKLLEFKRIIKLNKYRSEMTTQTKP